MFMMTFGLSAVLLVISLSLKTVLLSMRVMLKSLEMSLKAAGKVGKKVADDTGLSDSGVAQAVRKTRATAGKAVNAVKTTGRVAKGTAKTTGKVAVRTAKITKKVGQLSIKAIKLTIRALQMIINVIHSVVVFLLSLGVVGIVILVIIILFLVAAIAGALLSISTVPGGGFAVGGSGGLSTTILGGGPGIYGTNTVNPGTTQPGGTSGTVAPGVVEPGDTAALLQSLETMARWYIQNVPTYAGGYDNKIHYVKWYDCPLVPQNTNGVGDECGRFAAAYASLVSGKKIVPEGGIRSVYVSSASWSNAGWTLYTITELGGKSGLRPGDVMLCSSMADSHCVGGHAEVYISPTQSFGWGQIQHSYPSRPNNTLSDLHFNEGGKDLIYVKLGSQVYGKVWRYTGGG